MGAAWHYCSGFSKLRSMGNMIILMGPKHAGKTSAGRVLADLLEARFIDLDVWLEARTGKSPRTLYRESLELFCQAEAASLEAALETAAGVSGAVIAAGGGLIDNDRALALLQGRESLTLVYLEISPETAWNRIVRNSTGGLPPFLDPGNPQEAHRLLHEQRAGAYKALAHLCISGESETPQAVGRAIGEALANKGKARTPPGVIPRSKRALRCPLRDGFAPATPPAGGLARPDSLPPFFHVMEEQR